VGAEVDQDSCKTARRANSRYSQPLIDTPQTITVIPSNVIQERGTATLRDVLRHSPGITFQAGEGGGGLPGDQNFSLRGSSARNSLFIDGVRDRGAYLRDAFVLQQIEIVKGPTAALAGRSATAGAINQTTKTPRLKSFQSYTASGDSYARITADANFAADKTSALRLNLLYHHADTPGRDVVENERWGIAPSFAVGLGTDTHLKLDYVYVEQDNVPDYGLPWYTLTQTTAADPSHNGTFLRGAWDADVDRSNFYGLKDFDYEDVQAHMSTARLEHDLVAGLELSRETTHNRNSAFSNAAPQITDFFSARSISGAARSDAREYWHSVAHARGYGWLPFTRSIQSRL
jgi:catecholate siderophore receptor